MTTFICNEETTWSKPARRFGQRLFEFIVPIEAVANASRVYDAAVLCNRLAKLATGPTRRTLYKHKAACLRLLVCQFNQEIESHGDQTRYPGLLSIRLKSATRGGLHTHENWLDAA